MLTQISRGRICVIVLLSLYILAGVMILSTMTTLPQGGKARKHIVNNSRSKVYGFSPNIRSPSQKPRMQWCQPLRFLKDLSRPNIALASFPGSGNTWLRYLLQQATGKTQQNPQPWYPLPCAYVFVLTKGIHTGSVYKDFGLLRNGFPGEYVADSSVLVVKTHEKGPSAHQGYSKAVLLVRDPKQAIQAEFNRQGGGHIGFAPLDRYKIDKGKYWEKFVNEQLVKWKDTNIDWLFNFTNPTFVVFYDELVSNLEKNLRQLLKFLEVNITESQLQCALERREGIYRRKKRMIRFDHFTKDMKERINATKQEVYSLIYRYIDDQKGKKLIER